MNTIRSAFQFYQTILNSFDKIQQKIPPQIKNIIFYSLFISIITIILAFTIFKIRVYFQKNSQTPYEFIQQRIFFEQQYLQQKQNKKDTLKKDIPLPLITKKKTEIKSALFNTKSSQKDIRLNTHFLETFEAELPPKKIYSTPIIHTIEIDRIQENFTKKLRPNKTSDKIYQKTNKQQIKLLPIK